MLRVGVMQIAPAPVSAQQSQKKDEEQRKEHLRCVGYSMQSGKSHHSAETC